VFDGLLYPVDTIHGHRETESTMQVLLFGQAKVNEVLFFGTHVVLIVTA
jgi:hypothetical protein